MTQDPSQRRSLTTYSFVGQPHSQMVTAESVGPHVYFASSVQVFAPVYAEAPLVTEPVSRALSERDSLSFIEALQVTEPNEALRRAVARRAVERG